MSHTMYRIASLVQSGDVQQAFQEKNLDQCFLFFKAAKAAPEASTLRNSTKP